MLCMQFLPRGTPSMKEPSGRTLTLGRDQSRLCDFGLVYRPTVQRVGYPIGEHVSSQIGTREIHLSQSSARLCSDRWMLRAVEGKLTFPDVILANLAALLQR